MATMTTMTATDARIRPTTPTPVCAPSATRVVLDARMYPHIMDMVVGNALHGSLITLRAVSRTLREICDKRLARHLVMAPRQSLPAASPTAVASSPAKNEPWWEVEEWDEWDDPPEAVLPPIIPPAPSHVKDNGEFKVSITSPYGRIPLFRAWQQAIWKDTGAEVDDKLMSNESRLRAIRSLRGTQVIDILGAIIDPRPAIVFQLIGHPITLRMRRDDTGIAPQMAKGAEFPADFDVIKLYTLVVGNVHTAVMFCDLWDPVHPALQHPDVSHPSLTQTKQVLNRVVLNLYFDPDQLLVPPDINDAEYPLSVKEVVAVFRAKAGHRPRGAMRASRDQVQNFLDILLETIGFYLMDMRHTLVNVADLSHKWVAEEEQPVHWESRLRGKIRKDLSLRSVEGGETPDEILDRQLRFLTLDEFRREVGDHQFRIETVEELGS